MRDIELEEPYQWFRILYPTRKRDRDELQELLTGRGAVNPVAAYSILEYLLTPTIGRVQPTCKTVVVEERYRDKDHNKAMASYYSKSFRAVAMECIRLHFFSRRLPIYALGNLKDWTNDYIGFCVLRPFLQKRIGKTVLARCWNQPALEFPTCQGKFSVNLGGSPLNVSGSAFMEQVTMVAACASTALWISTTTLSQRFGLGQCSLPEITERASEYLVSNRPMPSEGLLPEQMVHCLRTMDYDPILLPVFEQKQTKHDIYSYIESEIPPILLCRLAGGGDHAIVGVGHGYRLPVSAPHRVEVEWPGELPLVFSRSSEWVPYLLINDDQRGIYRKLEFVDGGQPLQREIEQRYPGLDVNELHLEDWKCPVKIDMNMPAANYLGGEEIANIWGVIVPLPKNVLLTAAQAEWKAVRLIRLWHWLGQSAIPDDLVIRTYLIPSNEYKERIEESGIEWFIRRLLRGKPMPRWIWVTELSTVNSYNSTDPAKWLIHGEVIIDATSNAFTLDFLAFHYIQDGHGIVATMKPEHEDAEQALSWVWGGPDVEYPGWIRT